MKNKLRIDFWTLVGLFSLIFFGMFLVIPIIRMMIYALTSAETGSISLDNFVRFITKPYYVGALLNSVKVVTAAMIIVILVGVPLAYITTMFKIKANKLVNIIVIISMLSPPFLGAYSWILMFGRSGEVTQFLERNFGIGMPNIYGFGGILLVFVTKLFPYIYMYTKGALKKIDASLGEAAESLGYHGLHKVFKVNLPLVMPTILAGATIVFLRAFADYGTPRLIGEGYMTLPVIVYQEYVSETGANAFFASAVAMVMIFIAAIVFGIQQYISNRKNYTMSTLNPPQPKQLKGIANILAHLYVYTVAFIAILPQIYIIFISFRNTKGVMWAEGYSLNSYITVFTKSLFSITNTFKFGIIAIIVVVILGTLFAYLTVRKPGILSKILDTFIMFPYVIPGTIFGLLLLMSYNKGSIVLSGTATIIIISYIIRRMPYTVRSSAAILRQINPNIDEASASLGYGPMSTFFNITMQVMIPGIVSGAILSWITILNELSSTLMLYTGKTQTMTVTIFQEISRGGYGTAAALSTILTVTMIVSILLFFSLTKSDDISL
ncbi:ABC transporter permease [Amygdalobacter nucleatus]|uniref:ABC transporter, permease protein n=1 Tax=Amygdalobacter nucleatus TaxID=3029274 RepID=A0A133YHN9_9FIRM|nr:iron ABC transporter permease [Amygdalobacter nucleatus]KXB42715.1 ABC transporter, permease protein [Amygdalobacter nucleatus]MDF0486221.1 iron ABC transporter permease [Amygdalobacter nucleatus]